MRLRGTAASPVGGDGRGGPPLRRPICWWAINCAVFVAMVLNGVSIGSPTVEQLMHWGANNAGNVLLGGEWWRIVTAMFVHVGILHLATNMWCLWNLALLAEPLMGSWGVVAVYILTGAAGNLLSTLVNWLLDHSGRAGRCFRPVRAHRVRCSALPER